MALFELNIYGENDEIVKRFETDKVRWGVYLQATELSESIQNAKPSEKFREISAFVKKIFPNLTDEDIENADSDDVLNTFKQLIKKANGIKSPDSGKNA
jgi:hypothetical protein